VFDAANADGPMLQMLVNDRLAGEQVAVASTEQLPALPDQLDANGELGIADLRAILAY